MIRIKRCPENPIVVPARRAFACVLPRRVVWPARGLNLEEPMYIRQIYLSVVWCAVLACSTVVGAQDYDAVTRPGANIQRSMSLMATSTPRKRHTVRVLFYGQSITKQPWWTEVADDLRKRFPHADLKIENRAIGGLTAPALSLTAEYDLYPAYPDLLIFHVYGGSEKMDKWEGIIRSVRTRTAAEILLWTHHDAGRERDYAQSKRIREIAVAYNCGLVDVEAKWQKVLAGRKLSPSAFLKDGVHLNPAGCTLLAGMIKPFLIHDANLMTDESRGLVSMIPMSDSTVVKTHPDGSIDVTFTGNRIDAVASAKTGYGALAKVLVDGKSPGQIPGTFALTLPSEGPYIWMPAVNTISHKSLLVAESWQLDFLTWTPDASAFTYKVTGSVTGEDGQGSKHETFVSKSGRVVIEGKGNWGVAWALGYKKKTMPKTFRVTWNVYPMFVDTVRFSRKKRGLGRTVTLVQGLTNGTHTVRLAPAKGAKIDLAGFRVYQPPLLGTD